MMSNRCLGFFNEPCPPDSLPVRLDSDTVTDRAGLFSQPMRKAGTITDRRWGTFAGHHRGPNLAINGDFHMATDTASSCSDGDTPRTAASSGGRPSPIRRQDGLRRWMARCLGRWKGSTVGVEVPTCALTAWARATASKHLASLPARWRHSSAVALWAEQSRRSSAPVAVLGL